MTASPCPWNDAASLGSGPDYSSFNAGLPAANDWLGKAKAEHDAGRVRTTFLICGQVNCAYFSLRQIAVRGKDESEDGVASHVVWLALDVTHHGARLAKKLLLEILATCVALADRSAFRYITLDVGEGVASHVRSVYEKVGFVATQPGSPRLRMKVTTARRILGEVRAAGMWLVMDSAPVQAVDTLAAPAPGG
jgi:GNAT superfamily N-acetyltransferase